MNICRSAISATGQGPNFDIPTALESDDTIPEPIGITETLAALRLALAPAGPVAIDLRYGYLIACGNSPTRALALCLGCSHDKALEIKTALAWTEYCDVMLALNAGDSAKVERIVGLRAI